jgi:protoheme IX farnesyltransferase
MLHMIRLHKGVFTGTAVIDPAAREPDKLMNYKKAGFKLLPSGGGKDHKTAIQIMTYTLFLLPLGLLPAWIGLTGINSAVVATLCGAGFLASTFSLMKTGSHQSAKRIMFGSFLYLPIVQISYLLDKV